MKKICYIVAVFYSLVAVAQPPKNFYTTFGGEGIDIGYSVKEIYNRQYIIAGSTTSYDTGSSDAYLILADSMGHAVWQKNYGSVFAEAAKCVIFNPTDSGFVFTGYTSSYGNGGYDVYVVRTDKKGNLIWQVAVGGLDWEFGNGLVFSSDGNVVVCGSTFSAGHGKKDAYLLKLNISNGSVIWEKYFGGAEDDEFKAIYTKPGYNLYVVGMAKSYGEISGDAFLYKLDHNGDSLMRIIYDAGYKDWANSITLNTADEIFIAGGCMNSTGKSDALIVKYDVNGQFLWQQLYGKGGDDEEAFKIIPPANPTYSCENVVIYTTKEVSVYGKDIKTIFLGTDGSYYGGLNSGKFGFENDDEAFDIALTSDNGYIQAGYTKSFNSVEENVFLVKLDSTFNEGARIVGLKENSENEDEAFIYPSPILPADQKITITLPQLANLEKCVIEVFNSRGEKVSYVDCGLKNPDIQLPVSTWSSGLYLIKLIVDGRSLVYKIIKL
jgi:hypothetical protein